MKQVKRVWHYLIAEPFTWIFYCFFQPARFQREFEEDTPSSKRLYMILKLAIPIFLISYTTALIGRAILLPLHVIPYSNTINPLLDPFGGIAIGVEVGVACGMVFGIVPGIAFGIAFSIAMGITSVMAISIAPLLTTGITFGIASGIVSTIAGSMTNDISVGITIGIAMGIFLGIISAFSYGIALVITFGTIFIRIYILSFFRLPLYPVNVISGLCTYIASRNNPSNVFTYLHRSSLYWDERVYLPIPCLKQTLLIAAKENPDKAQQEIAFIIAERPQQIRATKAASLEIARSHQSLTENGDKLE